jgi:hypothetical protein
MRVSASAILVLLAATAAAASAQTFGVERALLIAPPTPPERSVTVSDIIARMGKPVDVVNRVWSFDSDGDDRVAEHELPERMQPLVARGDVNRNGYLDSDEIMQLVDRKPFTPVVGFSPARGLPTGLSGVVSDLRLPQPTHDQAMAIVRSVSGVRNVNDPNSLDVIMMQAKLRELLGEEDYENFVAAAARRHPEPVVVVRGVAGGIPGR